MNTADFESLQREFDKLVGAHLSLKVAVFGILILDITY